MAGVYGCILVAEGWRYTADIGVFVYRRHLFTQEGERGLISDFGVIYMSFFNRHHIYGAIWQNLYQCIHIKYSSRL